MEPCEICGEREVRDRCVACGRAVCTEHLWVQMGVCVECGEQRDDELLALLKERGAIQFGDFTLASGRKSNYYVDMKAALTQPSTLRFVSGRIAPFVAEAHKVAGVELGAVPLIVAVSLATGKEYIMVRKRAKEHGAKRPFEGTVARGEVVLFIEDVTTTGGTLRAAIESLREAGATVNRAVVVVDREEGGAESLAEIGVTLTPLIRARELLE
jgi:orotate phosphoribosyltransferase